MRTCSRCGGKEGAHYLACFLDMAGQSLGEDYPLRRPTYLISRPTKAGIEQAKKALAAFCDAEVTFTERARDAVALPVFVDAFNRCAGLDDPITDTRVRKYLTELRPELGWLNGTGGGRPTQITGLVLSPPPLTKAELAAQQTERIRQLATRSPNNGWHQPVKAGGTVESWEPEPEKPTRKRASKALAGAKPGKELPQEFRELIEPLLRLPGWRYVRAGGTKGSGKPRIYNAAGVYLTLPNTPSDHRGVLNTRTSLRNRLGAPL